MEARGRHQRPERPRAGEGSRVVPQARASPAPDVAQYLFLQKNRGQSMKVELPKDDKLK